MLILLVVSSSSCHRAASHTRDRALTNLHTNTLHHSQHFHQCNTHFSSHPCSEITTFFYDCLWLQFNRSCPHLMDLERLMQGKAYQHYQIHLRKQMIDISKIKNNSAVKIRRHANSLQRLKKNGVWVEGRKVWWRSYGEQHLSRVVYAVLPSSGDLISHYTVFPTVDLWLLLQCCGLKVTKYKTGDSKSLYAVHL